MFGDLSGHDAYELLHVSPDASSEEIQRAWRKLARTHHPDRFTDNTARTKAEQELRLINLARDVLLNRRASYDAFRDAPAVDEELFDDPWEDEPPPDPWDFDTPSSAPQDPWADATPGAAPPPPTYIPPRPPLHVPPPYIRPPWPQYRPPPRHQVGSRLGLGCVLLFGVLLFLWGFGVVLGGLRGLVHSDEPEPEAPVPGVLAGSWTGIVQHLGDDSTWDIELTLRKGKHNGKVHYVHGECAGTAVPIVADAQEAVTLRTVFPHEQSLCDVGNVHITPSTDGRIQVTYYKEDGVTEAATGTLLRR
ncbi:J domain-containing protein [Actinomadura sp. NEAU-AAG7]|uniref:J domain-containing protein n=1 Tax=Actinomadura sp. NEAU-AAG7 TaxID=2839640 RepID=UPI001BE4C61A|nr:J domain-containing protein [Actinomadura sp. NEAU-AAG7]MBT2211303.1 J domain-containing protein [Actinomadura sp. NEAU-AAG7]